MTTTYPWDKWPAQIEVRPNEWQWAMNLEIGEPKTLEQLFEHKRDTDGASTSRRATSPAQNPRNWPKLTFDQVRKMYDMSKEQNISLRKAFMLVCDRKKLSDEQIEMLADAPDVFHTAGATLKEADAEEAKRREKAKAFLAEVDAPAEQAQAKPAKRAPVTVG